VTSSELSGIGYFPVSKWNNSSAVFILETSDILTESLEDALYHCNDINAIVHRIARIVITTISSTRVNAFLFLFIKLNLKGV
jgi:hypothetical protein